MLSATTGMADKQRASRHAAAPALVVVAVAVAVVVVAVAAADMAAVGTGNRSFRYVPNKLVELEMERNRMLPSKLNFKTSYLVNLHSIAALIILFAVIPSHPFYGAATRPEDVFLTRGSEHRIGHCSAGRTTKKR